MISQDGGTMFWSNMLLLFSFIYKEYIRHVRLLQDNDHTCSQGILKYNTCMPNEMGKGGGLGFYISSSRIRQGTFFCAASFTKSKEKIF